MATAKRARRAQSNLRRAKNSRFSMDAFVDRFYIDTDGAAYISARVSDYRDIISPYSIKGYEWLNREFAEYLVNSAYYIPPAERVVLEICGCRFSEEQKRVIGNTVATRFKLRMGDALIDLGKNNRRAAAMMLLGIATLAVYLLQRSYTGAGFAAELVFLMFQLLSEDGFGLLMNRRRALRQKQMDAAQMADVQVVFNEEGC